MTPYLLVLSFIIFWIALEKKSINRKSFWLPLIVLSLFAGGRSLRVGTDTGGYVKNFISQLDVSYFKFSQDIEFGYQFLEYVILNITHNYFWLLFTVSLIVVSCYLTIIRRYSVNYIFSVFLFITLGVYTFFFNGMRQGLAMAIFVLATPYLLEKKTIRYLLICCFTSLFHISALFMIPFYFLVHFPIKLIYKVLISFILSLIGSSFLISYLASDNQRYEGYTKATEEAGGLLTLGFYTILLIFIAIFSYFYKIKQEIFEKLFAFYAVGVVFIIPIAMLGTNPSGPQRLINYFTWTLVLILPIVFKKINNSIVSSSFVILILIYFILTTTRFSDLTPYTINPIFEVL